jgi:hypothetical protein
VIAANLPSLLQDNELQTLFASCGTILSLKKFKISKDTKGSKGDASGVSLDDTISAVIQYASFDEAQKAVQELNGQDIGCKITVTLDSDSTKANYIVPMQVLPPAAASAAAVAAPSALPAVTPGADPPAAPTRSTSTHILLKNLFDPDSFASHSLPSLPHTSPTVSPSPPSPPPSTASHPLSWPRSATMSSRSAAALAASSRSLCAVQSAVSL